MDMAITLFSKTWEAFTTEELNAARVRLTGFVEATADKEIVLREVITENH
jgi:hypothetical protein